MLQIQIQAENLNELRSKTLAALGMYELPQQSMNFQPQPGEVKTQAAPTQAEAEAAFAPEIPKASKAPKATKPTKPKLASVPEETEVEDITEAEISEPKKPNAVVSMETARETLGKLLKVMDSTKAATFLQGFGAARVGDMNDAQRAQFNTEALKIIASN